MTAASRARLHVAAVVVAASVSGCGIRTDARPRALPADDVPFGLLEEGGTTTTTAPVASVPREAVLVYLVNGGRMFPVVREVNAPVTVAKSLTALLFGPQEDESAQGVRSAINPAAGVQARPLDSTTFLVDLSTEFAQGSTSEQVLGLAQIVYTATGVGGVTRVRFTLNGAPVEVPTPSGALTSEPIGRDAFGEFAPVPPGIQPLA